jgi:serine/threonine-protein kinase
VSDPLERLNTALADRYAMEREIGSGGMATVYLAEDLRHHRKVAAKVTMPERFLAEIRRMASGARHHLRRSVTDAYGARVS